MASSETHLHEIVDEAAASSVSDRQIAVRLHDFVRDEVSFGFTPYFDAASAEQTLSLRVGHCNPQARMMVKLFRLAGLTARFRPATIDNEVLHGIINSPPTLSHVFTEIFLDGDWRRLDSYIVDSALRVVAVAKLRSKGWQAGYGCHVSATGEWSGAEDAFSQVAAPDMILDLHEPVTDIEEFYRSREYRHRIGPLRYTTLFWPARLISDHATRTLNRSIERLRSEAT